MDANTRIEIQQQVVSENLGNEAVLLNLATGEYYSLNPTGVMVWELLRQTPSVADLRAALRNRYPDNAPSVDADLDRLLQELEGSGLIRASGTRPELRHDET